MRVLVTGAAGFLGSHVTRILSERGHRVLAVDADADFVPGEDDAGRRLRGDARDEVWLAYLLDGCDHFVALAALCGPVGYLHEKPYDILRDNDALTMAACDAAIASRLAGGPLRKVTFVSSSMVYERAQSFPSREGDELRIPPPATSYGFQKLAVEYYARAAREQHGLPFTIVRPFNCTGPGEPPGRSHVIADLARRMLAGEDPVRILGDGRQVRHFTHVADVARGIVMAMESPAADGEDFNLASGHAHTVLEVALMLHDRIRPGVPFRFEAVRAYERDVRHRSPDPSKALEVLGWKAEIGLGDMLDEMVAALRQEALVA